MTDLPHGPDITKESAQTMDNEDLLELAEKNCQTIYELAEHRGYADELQLDVVPRGGLTKQTKGSFASALGLESNREKFKEASADVSDRERAELLLQQNAINLSLIS